MKALIAIMVIAVLVLAVIAYLRTKQVKSLSSELEKNREAAFNVSIDYKDLKERCVMLRAELPSKITTQYLAMKLSKQLEGYISVDENCCCIEVVTPSKRKSIE